MRYLNPIIRLTLVLLLLSVSSSSPAHDVGEPALEQLPIWKRCCADHDCVAQRVRIIGNQGNEKVSVEIEGTQTKVDKEKLSSVPSPRTWVCYVDPNGAIVKVSSLNPRLLATLGPFFRTLMEGPSPLTRAQRKMLAIVASKVNNCFY